MAISTDLFPAQRKTKLPGGYMGKILRVDLTTGSMRDENLPEEPLLRKYIGGQALAEYILLKELPLDAKPYGVENKVVMMTGPLTPGRPSWIWAAVPTIPFVTSTPRMVLATGSRTIVP